MFHNSFLKTNRILVFEGDKILPLLEEFSLGKCEVWSFGYKYLQ